MVQFLWSVEYWFYYEKFLSNSIDLMKHLHRLTAQLSYGQDANEQVNGVLFFHENTAVPFAR